jgi:ketosteroid isomerase-like protein
MSDLESRMNALEEEVRRLRAAEDIRTVLSQYAIGVDEKRPHVLRPLFADNAHIGVPAWSVEINGVDAVMQFFEHYWGRFDSARRYYANEDVKVSGDTASVFMYWHLTQQREGQSVLGWGTYDWSFVRSAEKWLIDREIVNIRAMTTLEDGWGGQASPMQL